MDFLFPVQKELYNLALMEILFASSKEMEKGKGEIIRPAVLTWLNTFELIMLRGPISIKFKLSFFHIQLGKTPVGINIKEITIHFQLKFIWSLCQYNMFWYLTFICSSPSFNFNIHTIWNGPSGSQSALLNYSGIAWVLLNSSIAIQY